MLRKACLAFWILPRSGFLFLRKMSSCCCPAHRPLTHSLLSLMTRKLRCLLLSMIILYSSDPSSITCRSDNSDGAPDNTACLQAGSPSCDMTRVCSCPLMASYNIPLSSYSSCDTMLSWCSFRLILTAGATTRLSSSMSQNTHSSRVQVIRKSPGVKCEIVNTSKNNYRVFFFKCN